MADLKVWNGTFQSSYISEITGHPFHTSGIEGHLKVLLPSDPQYFNSIPSTRAVIIYTGSYRTGFSANLNLFITEENSQFTATSTLFMQTFKMTVTATDPVKVSGEYVTTSPADNGTFELYLTDRIRLPLVNTNYSQCDIL